MDNRGDSRCQWRNVYGLEYRSVTKKFTLDLIRGFSDLGVGSEQRWLASVA